MQELFYIGSPDGTGENLPVGDYNIFRNAVLANSPQCKFFVMISLGSVTWTPDTLVALMRKVDEQIRVDGWNFDFYWRATAYPDALKAAAEYAHLHGQLIGGSCLGAVDKIQPGSDYTYTHIDPFNPMWSILDEFNQHVKAKFGAGLSVVFHIPQNPQNAANSGCRWATELQPPERCGSVLYFAKNQQPAASLFFGFPCEQEFCEAYKAYNFAEDADMAKTIFDAMNTYGA